MPWRGDERTPLVLDVAAAVTDQLTEGVQVDAGIVTSATAGPTSPRCSGGGWPPTGGDPVTMTHADLAVVIGVLADTARRESVGASRCGSSGCGSASAGHQPGTADLVPAGDEALDAPVLLVTNVIVGP